MAQNQKGSAGYMGEEKGSLPKEIEDFLQDLTKRSGSLRWDSQETSLFRERIHKIATRILQEARQQRGDRNSAESGPSYPFADSSESASTLGTETPANKLKNAH